MSKFCAKCELPIEADGYAKCLGCSKRYHFGSCSIAPSTWRAKGQTQKDEWRCKACCLAAKSKLNDISEEVKTDGSTDESTAVSADALKLILDSVAKLTECHDKQLDKLYMNLKVHSDGMYGNLEKLVNALLTEFLSLKNDVKSMVVHQRRLSDEIGDLKNDLGVAKKKIEELELKRSGDMHAVNVSDSTASSAQGDADPKARMPMLYNTAVISGSTSQSNVKSNGKLTKPQLSPKPPPSVQVPSKTVPNNQQKVSSAVSVSRRVPGSPNVPQGSTQSNPTSVDGNGGWNEVQRRRARPNSRAPPAVTPKIGIGTGSSENAGGRRLGIVRPKSAMFVSRFDPGVSSDDIENLIKTSVNGLSYMKVTKMRTRFNNYASFHVEVYSSDLDKIDDVNLWPEGCLFKPYLGMLKPHVVIDESLLPLDGNSNSKH